jgi:hypothetical protein
LGQGIKIIHKVNNYNSDVIFWTLGSPTELIRKIEDTGFISNAGPIPAALQKEILNTQTSGRFPIKTPAIITIVVAWNALLLPSFITIFNGKPGAAFGSINTLVAFALLFLTCLALLTSEFFREWLLKPGHTIDSLRGFLYFTMFVTGVMFVAFLFLPR